MEIKQTIESIRDIGVDLFNAGRLACAQVIAKIDETIANSINPPEDE